MNPFRQLLKAGGASPPLGTWLMSASPLVAEAIGHSGFDWAVIDMEHSPLDLAHVVQMLQAIGNTRLVPVLRVPWNDTVGIKRVLDAGAFTLMVPFVQNAAEARAAVTATRYPPLGVRGMAAMGRASRFGTAPDHFHNANQQVSVIVQLETRAALGELEAICAVAGVDALFLGPADLSGDMGHVGQLTHPEVMQAMADAVQRCHAAGKPVGTVGGTPEVVAQYRAMGFDYVAIASDLGLMMRAAREAMAALKNGSTSPAIGPAPGPAPASGY
jgi:2-keto-3-deoxy-L-rhamnonate aldolase RhmA